MMKCIVGIIAQADVATHVDELEKTGEMVKEISQEQLFARDSLNN